MAFRPPKKNPQFGPLKANLTQVQTEDNALYQVIQRIIERLTQFQDVTEEKLAKLSQNGSKKSDEGISAPSQDETYLTLEEEVETLQNSRQLVAGTNITFDLTVDNALTINSSGEGGGSGTLTPHAPTHQPGGSDAMAVDAIPTVGSLRTLGTGPNQAAPGDDTRFTDERTPTAHALTHSNGNTDPVSVVNLAGFPGGTTTFLRADRTFVAPPASAVGVHAPTHSNGGADPVDVKTLAGYNGDPGTHLTGMGTFTVTPSLPPNIAYKNVDNQFSVTQTVANTLPKIVWNQTTHTVDQRKIVITDSGGILYIQAMNDAESTFSGRFHMNRDGTIVSTGNIHEQNRGTAMGYWMDVPYNASNFNGGLMTWTVASGNVYTNRYTLIGKTLIWIINISGSSLSGSPDGQLNIALPGGISGIVGKGNCSVSVLNDGTVNRGFAFVPSAGAIGIQKLPYANFALNSGLTAVALEIFLEIV